MKVTIFGSGYVGLVTGACLAEVGNEVVCVDIDQNKVNSLNKGVIPIYEPGLDDLVRHNLVSGRLKFTTNIDEAVAHGLFQFIAVGTPPNEDGSADLQYVLAVAKSIGDRLDGSYKVIVDKSTVPVGTAQRVYNTIQHATDGISNFDVVSNPEFLKEGSAISDFMKPDRIVVGSDSSQAAKLMDELYSPFTRNHDCMVHMDVRSAELTKYAANAMLATKISFMNELANIADRVGADIELVRKGIGSDQRIGYHFIYPGCGYGGSCFPKDVSALVRTANDAGYEPQLLEAVEYVNLRQKMYLLDKIFSHYGPVRGKTFALWGLSFKPNTDDMREAPSRTLIDNLTGFGAKIKAYDPVAMDEANKIYTHNEGFETVANKELALEGADALIIVTEWQAFRSPDFEEIKQKLKSPVIFDGRNLYNPASVRAQGFTYYCIGRP